MFETTRSFAIACTFVVGALIAGASALAAPTAKPPRSIVLVHGAFADGSSWDRVVPMLQAKGYNVVAVHEPMTSFAEDVAATKRAIAAQPGEVILVGHSYGGAVISEAGTDSKVVGLVYVAAFGPDKGESINDLGKGKPPPSWATALKVDAGGFAWLPPATVAADFAQDLSAAEAQLLAAKQGPIFTKNFGDKLKAAAWHDKRVWYVLTLQDHMIDPQAQAQMAKRMNASITNVSASHVVMLSKPKDVADVILSAAAAAAPRAAVALSAK
jgi:pimeloyl-ACP methyl ester carboxylesterase